MIVPFNMEKNAAGGELDSVDLAAMIAVVKRTILETEECGSACRELILKELSSTMTKFLRWKAESLPDESLASSVR